eukprot:TRINITY_DN775_c0_g1_i2.p1 TRINITY_DN775_c0_g1~~TRINITY_DN775_c0_g1_i2.p1  ORF type:complete len:166 (+),score=7.52 TRINITY_DN775_c0_g1_i2:64-561(+)
MMDRRMFTAMPQSFGRNETLFTLCIWSSIIMFLLNIGYAIILFMYLETHEYHIITEHIAVVLALLITLALFVSLTTIYTITLGEHGYHDLKEPYLGFAAAFLVLITLLTLWVLIESMGTTTHAWELFKLIIWPVLGEYIVYIAAAYSFYNLYNLHTMQYLSLIHI